MILNKLALMILNNSNFKSVNKSFTLYQKNLTKHKKDKESDISVC